ncbi:MAG TPA: UDP-N-acetylmuramate dehydrogenase [Dehalococcoidia bacterium]|nr:UDP-N-acetylmuramate dehydrogenase [Dehalococcoidia bacterium]
MTLDSAFLLALEAIALVREKEPLSRHTTIGIGGSADAYVALDTQDQLTSVLSLAHDAAVPVFILGSGSNIVVGDRGMRGVVVENNAHALSDPQLWGSAQGSNEQRYLFRAEAGCSFAAISRQLAFAGYAGLEWACGIPGTVGGAVVYNAGAYGGCLADVLQRVAVWDPSDGVIEYAAEDLGMVYRGSAFTRGVMAGRAVLWAEFALWQGDAAELRARVADFDSRRLKAQPRGRNAGSFFKNPPDHPAWRLLDGVGLRGHRIGGAEFSAKHCNFLINTGDASAADVGALKRLAQQRVRDEYGIELQDEVALVGEGFGDD